MMIKYVSVAIFLFLLSCNSKKQDSTNSVASIPMRMESMNFGTCDTLLGHGTELSVKYTEPAGDGDALQKIKASLEAKILERVNSDMDSATISQHPDVKTNIKTAFNLFDSEYKKLIKEYPDAPGCWEISITGDSVLTTSKYLFYKLQQYTFMGGAHPNSFTSYHAYDLTTGDEKDQRIFVTDSLRLLNIVEKRFREKQQLSPQADLEKEGYFLSEGKFFLPQNYVFVKEGMRVYYNAYEIAPYSHGAIEFTIPYNELQDCVSVDQIF
jgi:hypothetical protein